MTLINKREIGNAYEDVACEMLIQNNCTILQRNFRNRFGEIDIIFKEKDVLVFCEVKYRKNDLAGSSGVAITAKKQRTICKVASYYRMLHQIAIDAPVRYDCILIDRTQVQWIRNAFLHV